MSIITSNNLLIIGDSHVRTYPVCKNIYPIFAAPGKSFNFLSIKSYQRVKDCCFYLLDNALRDIPNFKVILPFGEASTRFATSQSWEPTDAEPKNESFNVVKEESFKFINLLQKISNKYQSKIELLVITPPYTFREGQNKLIEFFTEIIQSKLTFYNFINGIEFYTKNYYSTFEIYSDSVHCNSEYGKNILCEITNLQEFEKLDTWPSNPGFSWLLCNKNFLCYQPKVDIFKDLIFDEKKTVFNYFSRMKQIIYGSK